MKATPRVPQMCLNVKKIENKILVLFIVFFFLSSPSAYLENYKVYINVLHIKGLLCYCRCLFSSLELCMIYNWWVWSQTHTTVTFQYRALCLFCGELENYGHLKSTRPIAHKSEVVGHDVGVVYVWVWCMCGCGIRVGVLESGCDNVCNAFISFSLLFTQPHSQTPCFENMRYGWWVSAPNIHSKFFLQCVALWTYFKYKTFDLYLKYVQTSTL